MRQEGAPEPGTARPLSTLLALFLLGCLLYLPHLGARELEQEEARRVIPAREMAASGDWVEPTIWGRPYLNKPPLYLWAVAATARVTGSFDELAVRLPAILSKLLTALAVYAVARRLGGRTAGVPAGALFLVTWAVMERNGPGEIDPTFALFVFVSTAAVRFASDAERWAPWVLLSGAALAGALLTKGPPALVFWLVSAAAVLTSGGSARFLRSPRLWGALALGLLPAALWLALLLSRRAVDGTTATHTWAGQLLRASEWPGWNPLLRAPAFLLGAFASFLPPTLVALAGIEGRLRERRPLTRDLRFVVAVIAASGLAFALAPIPHVRYVQPLVPWCCVLAGATARDAFPREPGARWPRLAVACLALAGLVGALPLLASVYVSLRPSEPVPDVGALGWVLGLAAALVTWTGLLVPRLRRRHALALLLVAFGSVKLFLTYVLLPREGRVRPYTEAGATIAEAVPPGATVYTDHWGDVGGYNELYYADRELVHRASPSGLPPGALFLHLAEPDEAGAGVAGEELAAIEVKDGRRLVLLRLP